MVCDRRMGLRLNVASNTQNDSSSCPIRRSLENNKFQLFLGLTTFISQSWHAILNKVQTFLFTTRQNVRPVQTESISRQQIKCDWSDEILREREEKKLSKTEKVMVISIFSIPFNAFKGFHCLKIVKTLTYVKR